MKKLFSRLPKKLLAAAVVAGIVLGVTTGGTALIGGDREVRPYTPGNTPGFNHVTFNSFTGVPNIGDERNFLTGKISEAPGGFYDPMNQLRAGDEILMRVYVHNNADASLNASGAGVAKNTRVRVDLPEGLAQDQTANAFISADNATPAIIEDTLSMNGQYPFQIEYVPGSARVKTNTMDVALSDTIVTNGVQIGDDQLDGNVSGCFEYVALVTIKVKVKAPSYQLKKQVRFEGQTKNDWKETVSAKAGQTLEWKLEFDNVGSTLLEDVVVLDQLPAGLTVVPGSVKQIDGNFPAGNPFGPEVVQNNGRQINAKIGNVNPGINSIVTFKTKVNADAVKCGVKTLVNSGYATPNGHGTIKDDASVTVTGENCEPKTPSYICESLTVEKLGGRKVRATVKAPASNGASFKNVSFNYGDGSTAKVTTNLVDEYEFKADGTFKITATVTFSVNGVDKTVSGDACAATVSFVTPGTPELPKTGAGSIIGLFGIVTLIGAVAHNVLSRRTVA